MMIDLVPIWAAILGLGVFMYVLMDGFDLGVGILFPFAPDESARDFMMHSVAPIWDGNETWLVLGGVALLAAFPLAFSVILPALYFPFLFMLLGLLFRGVAFEFRNIEPARKAFWSRAFNYGSIVATFSQGIILGAYIEGFKVVGREFAGSTFSWVTPFSLLTGVGLLFGYALQGATWLVLKTEGPLQEWAKNKARICLAGVMVFILMVSLWTPFMRPSIAIRWFSWPDFLYLFPVPVLTILIAWWLWDSLSKKRDLAPFFCSIGLFVLCYAGLGISLWPNILPPDISLWQAASDPKSQIFLLLGTLFLLPVILMYIGWSYWVFRGKVREDVGYH
ncbi:MAG TPA: cytochrome d ubiquinol oxidase subunit II [Burkholderiales bacterium]|nr:cytochrome d ubiquinol oxidase subunit II [Burkholderiales bacterium]